MSKARIHQQPKFIRWCGRLALAGAVIVLCVIARADRATQTIKPKRYYLPGPQASKIVTVTLTGNADNEVTVLTQAVAVKENRAPRDRSSVLARFTSFHRL